MGKKNNAQDSKSTALSTDFHFFVMNSKHHLFIQPKNITKLQRVQNSRVTLQKRRRTHADDLLSQLHRQPIGYRIEYKIARIMYKALKFRRSRYIADLLIHRQQVGATRSEGQCRLHQPVTNIQTSSRGFRYAARQSGTCYHRICELMKLLRLLKV